MVNFNAWRTSSDGALATSISDADRAASIWGMIQRNPTSITLKRGSSTLSAQTVRIEISNSGGTMEQRAESNAVSGERMAIIFGIRNHATLSDTDIQTGDMLAINGEAHRVTSVINVPGGIEAHTEVIQ